MGARSRIRSQGEPVDAGRLRNSRWLSVEASGA